MLRKPSDVGAFAAWIQQHLKDSKAALVKLAQFSPFT